MGIEDTIIKVVRDENNMLLGKLEDVINHAISGIRKAMEMCSCLIMYRLERQQNY